MTIRAVLLSFLALAAAAHAFSLRPTTSTTGALTTAPSVSRTPLTTGVTTALYAASRRQFVLGGGTVATAFVISGATPFLALAGAEETTTLPNGVSYTVQKTGTGPEPSIGELAAIRFKATAGDNVIDDIFDTAEPYYTRVGSGGMLKGVEAVLPMMRVGDRWTLVIPVRRLLCVLCLIVLVCFASYSHTFIIFISMFLSFTYTRKYECRAIWRLDQREGQHRRANRGFHRMPPLSLKWKWWDCLERNPNSLNSLVIKQQTQENAACYYKTKELKYYTVL
jgi:hypothetical protein